MRMQAIRSALDDASPSDVPMMDLMYEAGRGMAWQTYDLEWTDGVKLDAHEQARDWKERRTQHLLRKGVMLIGMVDGRSLVSRHWARWVRGIDAKGQKGKVGGDPKRWKLRTLLWNDSSWNPRAMQNVRMS